MKALTLLTVATLGLSSLAFAGDFHGQFQSRSDSTATVSTPVAQAQTATFGQETAKQDIFEQNNNWHVQHSNR